jgi:Sec-independent protein secretion pathway component TatC
MATYIEAPEDQLSEEGTMSFLDHLDELRKRLVRIAIFIAVAFVVSWIFPTRYTIFSRCQSAPR